MLGGFKLEKKKKHYGGRPVGAPLYNLNPKR